MKSKRAFSITKFGESLNEDAILVKENVVAISDGAGGGGVFADEWSRYLVGKLPENPFSGFDEFDSWVNGISDEFYDTHEEIAKKHGGLFLEKFYDEGSFATLVAIWRVSANEYIWVSYGDSVAFAYNPMTNTLEHSFTHLVDFNQAPRLISLISPLDPDGFRTGHFIIEPGTYVFAASDALAHYIIARYDSVKGILDELSPAIEARSRNSSYIKSLLRYSDKDYFEGVIRKLSRNASNPVNTLRILKKLYDEGLIGLDDYSLVFMPKTGCEITSSQHSY